MFEKIANKVTNKFIKNATETAKVEIEAALDEKVPFIIGAITICVTVFSLIGTSKKDKKPDITSITINNYYFE
jgi:hypothetical protein